MLVSVTEIPVTDILFIVRRESTVRTGHKGMRIISVDQENDWFN